MDISRPKTPFRDARTPYSAEKFEKHPTHRAAARLGDVFSSFHHESDVRANAIILRWVLI